MECLGCRKLIPTHLFYDHLVQNPMCCKQEDLQANRSPNNLMSILRKSHDGLRSNNTTNNNTLILGNGMTGNATSASNSFVLGG